MTKGLAQRKRTDQGKFPIITPIFTPKYDVISIITEPWRPRLKNLPRR